MNILHFFLFLPILAPSYYLKLTALSTSNLHRDLRVTFPPTFLGTSLLSYHLKTLQNLRSFRLAFSPSNSIFPKKTLYISLVRSRLTYASQILRRHLIKDMEFLEQVHQHATKSILMTASPTINLTYRLSNFSLSRCTYLT